MIRDPAFTVAEWTPDQVGDYTIETRKCSPAKAGVQMARAFMTWTPAFAGDHLSTCLEGINADQVRSDDSGSGVTREGRNSPPSRGSGRGLPASFIPLSSFPRKRESRSSSWLCVFVRDFSARTKTRSHEEGETKSAAPRPLPPAGREKDKNRFPTLFGCASLDPGSFASWTKRWRPAYGRGPVWLRRSARGTAAANRCTRLNFTELWIVGAVAPIAPLPLAGGVGGGHVGAGRKGNRPSPNPSLKGGASITSPAAAPDIAR